MFTSFSFLLLLLSISIPVLVSLLLGKEVKTRKRKKKRIISLTSRFPLRCGQEFLLLCRKSFQRVVCLPAGYVPGTPVYREMEGMYDEIIELKKVAFPSVLC